MSQEPDSSRYANELLTWEGFQVARNIRAVVNETSELGDLLEQHRPGVVGRIGHMLDLLRDLEAVPPHTLPIQLLQAILAPISALNAELQNPVSDPATHATNVEGNTNQTLALTIPLLGAIRDRDIEQILGGVREQAQSITRGLRTSAGHARSAFEKAEADLKQDHESAKTTLRSEWEATKQSLVEEAAQMRQRVEATTTEARTNAEAHLGALRTEADALRKRADDAYRETLAAFEADRQAITTSREQLETEHAASVKAWSEAVTEARARIEAEIDELKGRLDETVQWAENIKGDIQMAALAAGFEKARKRYSNRAWVALAIAGVLAAATIAVTLILFSTLWEVPQSASNSEIARHIGLRLGAISLPLVAALFAARVYRTNSHLEAVNAERSQASTAFEGFAVRASDDNAKDAMLVILAQLVFAGRDTGHHTEEHLGLPVNLGEVLKQLGPRN